ncbi:PREDICTED: TNF receptor-associated factor 3-like isoform X3 [Acropora digitifera]|uniref:TNF receptor-associated factor 3-like isoform X3 n=1 Tax=Acropora digitifera TaxID=70779 RepID=UPI00077B2602|nr:PREDICTED: TNF receptor-associated factor 3-like isoform X3 [Acropora digitifera]
MPGYQLANCDKSKIDKKYFCSFCELLVREAMQTTCGHLYCFSCLGNLRDRVLPLVLVCLVDKQQLQENEVFADNFMRREVASIVVSCISTKEGCPWKGEVRHLEAHTVGCDFQKVKCVHPECGILIKKTSLPHHLKNECEFRVVTCELCHSQVVFCKLKLHKENECPAYPIICDKCEKARIPRGKMADHQNPILGDCEKIEGPCPFSQIGCSKKEVLSHKEKKKHLSEENIHHNVLLLQFAVRVSKEMESVLRSDPRLLSSRQQMFMNYDNVIQDLFNQMQIRSETERHLQEMLRQHSERITAIERKLVLVNTSGGSSGASSQRLPDDEGGSVSADIERRVTDLGNKTADHEVLIVENNRIAMESSREAANLRRQLDNVQENSRRSEQRMESIEHALALRNVTLADLEEYVKKQEFLSYDGQLTWKITEYARKRSEAVNGQKVSFYSPSFYTSRYGYKMCARIYLNGDGMGRGTHISLFFVVMRGEYDAILRWPFRQKVTFMLLDQDNVEHVIDAFRPDPNSSSFQRPRRETNIASGCPTFCSIEELNNHAYVRDDTMFFKIIVDTSDL